MIMIRSANKNRTSPAIKQKRYLLWFLIISLAVGWIATACETAPEHPAVGDTTPSAEATNAYPDTDTTGTVDTAQTEKPSQTAPQTTAPADTQDPVMELTPEQIRNEILTWDGVADFQDGTIYTTFTQTRVGDSSRTQFYNMVYEIQERHFEDNVKHIKIGEAVLDMAYTDADDGFGTIMKGYCITAVTTRGQTVSFENDPLILCYPNNFNLLYTENITLVGHGPHCGNWWFINNTGVVTDLREDISIYSREGYVYAYYYDDNNTLCYSRKPKKFMNIHDSGMFLDACVSPDELSLESGTVAFNADGAPVYTVLATRTVGMDSLEGAFQEYISYYKSAGQNPIYTTLDEYLAHNATIYECIK